jgi:hypothetical protein
MFRDPFYGASEWLDMVEDVVDGVVDTGSSVVNYGSEVVSNLKKPFWVDPVVAGYLVAEKYILDNSYDNLVARYSDPVALSNDLNFIVTVAPPATIHMTT